MANPIKAYPQAEIIWNKTKSNVNFSTATLNAIALDCNAYREKC